MNIGSQNRLNNGSRCVIFNQFEYEAERLNDAGTANPISQFIEASRRTFNEKVAADLKVAAMSPAKTARLSKLQKKILLLALKWHGVNRSDVYNVDVKTEVFGWSPLESYNHYIEGGWERHWTTNTSVTPGTARRKIDSSPVYGQVFSKNVIGHDQYNAVSVSVTRALKRLISRNLLIQTGLGWSLTQHGLDHARTHCAKEAA